MKGFYRFWVACIAISFIALVVAWFVFETRYMWFVSGEDFKLLRYGFLIGVGLIILTWVVYPSRVLIGLIGVGVFVFPPILRGDKFVAVDTAYSIWMLGVVLLLLGATELNRRARRRSISAHKNS